MIEYVREVLKFVAAIAWPLVTVLFLLEFRKQLGETLKVLPTLLDRVQKLKISNMEAEMERQSSAVSVTGMQGAETVSDEQVVAAIRVGEKSLGLGSEPLRARAVYLVEQYQATRSLLPSGTQCTQRMVEIVTRMRTIAIAAEQLLVEFAKAEDNAGMRLFAIAILQMKPRREYFGWLALGCECTSATSLFPRGNKYGQASRV